MSNTLKGLTADRVLIDETLIYPIKTQISGGYGTIPVLYDRIAQSLGLPTDKAHYDCTKIEVSCEIQDQVFSYYKKENISSDTISMWWVCYGPKTNDSLQATQVLVQEGWYKYEGNNMTRLYNYRTSLRKADGPCKDCPDRYAGCHSKCEKYISWKAERQILLDKKKAQTDLNDAIIALNYNTRTSIKKHQNKRK